MASHGPNTVAMDSKKLRWRLRTKQLRKYVNPARAARKLHLYVADVTKEFDDIQASHFGVREPKLTSQDVARRRKFVYARIEQAGFQKWVVFVAGIGFLTDAYDIFAVNLAIPMIDLVYWGAEDKAKVMSKDIGMKIATLVGTFIGQITFGILADRWGRRRVYGLELTVVAAGTIGVALAAQGVDSMNIFWLLIVWRFIMGIGIGADYPLSAVLTSEFAPPKHRPRMLAAVFFMQPVGQLLGIVVAIIATWKYEAEITNGGTDTTCASYECKKAIDGLWRWVIGFGVVPALVGIGFRLTMPESPLYTIETTKDIVAAERTTAKFFPSAIFEEDNELDMAGTPRRRSAPSSRAFSLHSIFENQPSSSTDYHPQGPTEFSAPKPRRSVIAEKDELNSPETDRDEVAPAPSSEASELESRHQSVAVPQSSYAADDEFPKASWKDAHDFFWLQGNWRYLLGTSQAWLLHDFAFYGLGMNSLVILRKIWDDKAPNQPVYNTLFDNALHSLIIACCGALLGGIVMIKIVKYWSHRDIQLWGFIALFVLFVIIGGAFEKLLDSPQRGALIVLYGLCQFVFNVGPNPATFMIPAEVFPTRYRCSAHGISAASGKLGSVVVQIFLSYTTIGGKHFYDPGATWLGKLLIILSAFMLLGAVVTKIWVPETRDKDGNSRPLHDLAKGYAYHKKGARQPDNSDIEGTGNLGARMV